MTRKIDTLGLGTRQVRSLEALHRKVNDPWRYDGKVSPAQLTALRAAVKAALEKGETDPKFFEMAKKLELL